MIRTHPSFHISIFIMVSLKEKENLLKANICRVSRFGTISLISKQYKNTCRGVLFFLKLQVLHNTPSEVFLTLLMMMMNCFWGVDLALFPAGTIVRDPHHRESPTCHEQGLNLRRTWVQAVVITTTPRRNKWG